MYKVYFYINEYVVIQIKISKNSRWFDENGKIRAFKLSVISFFGSSYDRLNFNADEILAK